MKGNLYELVRAHVSGVGLTEAARRAGMSKSTAHARLQTAEAQALIAEVRDEMRAGLRDWTGQVRTTAEKVLEAVAEILDGEPEPATVVALARVVLPEVTRLLSIVSTPEQDRESAEGSALPVESSRDALRRKLGLMEERAREVLEAHPAFSVIHGEQSDERKQP